MGIPIRVLIVEDSTDDAELILLQLRRAGYDPVSERVQTAEAMKTALERDPWDLVVSDYSMPRFDAPAALNLLNQSGLDVPFIVVSGSIGEDIAVAMMKTGAHDYVLKQNLTRLVSAVQRELREAENRRHKKLAEQANQQLQIERDGLLERLKQENEDLAALTRVTANAISTLELNELLRVLLERVMEVMHADTATILLAEGAELRVRASIGAANLSDSTHVRHVGECFAGAVAQRLKPVYVEDAAMDPLVTDPLIRERGIRSMLGVPLKRNGTLIGVLHTDWLSVRPCRDREVHMLEITAERCAAAIQNAQLYQEAKRVTVALTESEARLRRVVESDMMGILFWDVSGGISEANDAFLRTVGFTQDDVRAGRVQWDELTPPEYRALDENALREIAATGACAPYEKEYSRKDGSRVPVLIGGTSFPGEPVHGAAFVLDITERRQREGALRVSDLALKAVSQGVVIAGRDGRILTANDAFASITGYSKAEILGRTTRFLQGPLTDPHTVAAIGRALDKVTEFSGEILNYRKDGATFWNEMTISPVLSERGELTHFIGITRDITARKRAEAELSESEERFRQLAETINEVFWMKDPVKQRMIYVSPAYEMVWGRTCASLHASPSNWLDAIHPEDRERIVQSALTDQTTGSYDTEYRVVQPDGTARWVHDRGFPVRNEAGEIYRIVGVSTDITVRKLAETQKENEGKVLELIAQGGPLPDLLTQVLLHYEMLFPGLRGSVLLLDPDGRRLRHAAAPNLPLGYSQAIDGLEIGPDVGSCGTAAHTGKTTVAADIARDPRWSDFKDLALGHGLQACWSVPILGAMGRVLGTVALYSNVPRAALPSELLTLERGAYLASVAIERQLAEEAMRRSLLEKEALLKEVHHRVKNNLQVITSLLRLEANRSGEPAAREVLKDMQGRIQAMALLHEALYRGGTFASVDLGAYLKQLATQSFRALNTEASPIQLDLDLAPVRVDMDQAIPCGLLVNELISNCLKHAFPHGRTGGIQVALRPIDGGAQLRLSVSDAGVGLPADFESRRGRSLGLQLVSDLARQLGGRLEIEPGPGAVFAVTFAVGAAKE